METIVRIKETLPLQTIEYQDRMDGSTQVLRKKQLIVTQGDQVFMVEANGKLAESIDANTFLQPGTLCFISCRLYTREFLTKENTRGFSTDIQVRAINPI